MARPRYIIDPGHGGYDSGAVGVRIKEKDVVLDVARRMRELLRKDGRVDVFMTRDTDVFVSLAARASEANRVGAKLVSIHANAGGGTGFEAFTSPGQTASDPLATDLLESYAKAFSGRLPGRYDMSDGDPDKEARFTVLTSTRGPAVLFELAFVDRGVDHDLLESPSVRQEMADALVAGILKHEFGDVPSPKPEPTPEPSPGDSEEVVRLRKVVAEARAMAHELLRLLDL